MCILDHCHVSKSERLPKAQSDCSIFFEYRAHAAPQKDAVTIMFHCRHHAFFFVFLTIVMPYTFEAISSKNISLGLITPEYRVPVVFFFFSMGPGKY
ncbi:unnamed protein product [Staurois parvus]|uniref:Uncharacterized protein n=1 Tax=Staurois parvus TaxID=386267 RepID=A0ABN9E2L7_9NEOB|nr:unnamed protein product [Staurois parvus]